MSEKIYRTLHPEIKIIGEKEGIVEYIASDETIDLTNEVIRAKGWRFDFLQKNAPFVDSHNYESVDKILGKIIDWRIDANKLIETVQWAVDVAENRLAQLGWRMTQAGYLKAVSVGFMPLKVVSKWDQDPKEFYAQLNEMGLSDDKVRHIYVEQQQLELSACVVGANPSAVARCYKAGLFSDDDLDYWSRETGKLSAASAKRTDGADAATNNRSSDDEEKILAIKNKIKKLIGE